MENAGAETAHRYEFQYCCAAARLLAALVAGARCAIVCEWHEDYLVTKTDVVEAVSVKHREGHLAAWTIPSLVSDGNLRHLFDTFARADGVHCSFESNRCHNAQELWDPDSVRRADARTELARRLDAAPDDVDRFVDRLTIVAPPMPDRCDIAETFAARYAAPALDALGLTGLHPSRVLRIACDLVGQASRDRVGEDAWTAILAASPTERPTVMARHQLEARRVTSDEVRTALLEAERQRIPRLQATAGDAPPETTMTRKLEAGGLGPSVVETARRRRRLWYSHRAEVRDLGEREAELRSLQEWVQDQANASEVAAIATEAVPYGPQMYDGLVARVSAEDAVPEGTRPEDRNPALLTGAAFELTDECSVWWSPRSAVEGHFDQS